MIKHLCDLQLLNVMYFILLDLDPDILECRTACLSKYEPLNGRFIFSVYFVFLLKFCEVLFRKVVFCLVGRGERIPHVLLKHACAMIHDIKST